MGAADALAGACAVLALAQVAAWTVDLEAVRRFFDNQKKHDEYQQHLNNYYGEEFDEYDGAPEGPRALYAEEYGYEGYMERKVHGVVRKGGKYLDGLRLALENYKQTLENCTLQFTQVELSNASRPPPGALLNGSTVAGPEAGPQWPRILNLTASVLGFDKTPAANRSRGSGAAPGVAPGVGPRGRNASRADLDRVRCANATREREHVRRLVDLALYTTRQLQDRAMKEMIYAGHPGHDGEERELIIRLAWFLDRLAHITGYEPEAKKFVDETERTSSTTAAPPSPLAVPVPEDVKRQMIECVKRNSSLPATLRCSFPFQLPPLLMMTLNITGNTTAGNATAASGQRAPPDADKQASNLLETLLIVTDMWSRLPPSPRPARSVRKRSLNDPMKQFLDYYMKQKTWMGANAWRGGDEETNGNDGGVDNDLAKTFTKRSEPAKQRYLLRVPKEQRHRISHRKYKPSGRRADKLAMYLTKVRGGAGAGGGGAGAGGGGAGARRLHARKRAAPRRPEDPMQDISYYVKNKPGTNVVPSLAGALRVRLALERIFRTGDIEVVRRYGANYNPLVPLVLAAGDIKSISDI